MFGPAVADKIATTACTPLAPAASHTCWQVQPTILAELLHIFALRTHCTYVSH